MTDRVSQPSPPLGADGTRALADATGIERLVNAFLREARAPGGCGSGRVAITLHRTGTVLHGRRVLSSLVGHHRYDRDWRVGDRPVGACEVAAALAREVGADAAATERFVAQVADSVRRTACYLTHRTGGVLDEADPLVAGERALVTGHAFHPTPKAAAGFDDRDSHRYAPELGARFPLAWVAVRADSVTQWARADAADALASLRRVAPAPADANSRVLPVHPWQADWLDRSPLAADLVRAGILQPLGQTGPPVVATSSVRTVLLPDAQLFLKLPLGVRVTNYVRTNPTDQLRRAVDASHALATLQPPPGLRILPELATQIPTGPVARLAEDLGVLLRAAPPRDRAGPVVTAALCDDAAGTRPSPLAVAVRHAAAAYGAAVTPHWVDRWLRAYLEATVVPAALWLLTCGVSLEAHVQNCLVRLRRGWPVQGFARDLEGASLDRAHPMVRSVGLPDDSPALYDTDTAWHRFAYYVLVNHLGEVAATLARELPTTEERCWTIAAHMLDAVRARHDHMPGGRHLSTLLRQPELPAKANLTSLLAGHSEHPAYVTIPNPLARGSPDP